MPFLWSLVGEVDDDGVCLFDEPLRVPLSLDTGRGRGGRAKADSDAGVPVRRSTRAPVPSKSRR